MDGILVINKPQHWTSHDCVAVCRRASGVKRVGHGGTLDPMAEGVLPIFIGRATRIMEYMDLDVKEYRCRARLGIVTDTQDVWGNVIREDGAGADGVDEAVLRESMAAFHGEIEQTPPQYSAIKVKGKRLYEYAREGIEVEVKPRRVFIEEIEFGEFDKGAREFTFRVICSKGTYVRTICSDIGERLGCGCSMTALVRTANGPFTLENALSPEEIKAMDAPRIEERLLPVDFPLRHFGRCGIASDRARYFVSGNSIRWHQVRADAEPEEKSVRTVQIGAAYRMRNLYRVYRSEDGRFLGTGRYDAAENALKPDKIFVTRQEL